MPEWISLAIMLATFGIFAVFQWYEMVPDLDKQAIGLLFVAVGIIMVYYRYTGWWVWVYGVLCFFSFFAGLRDRLSAARKARALRHAVSDLVEESKHG